MSKLVCPRCGSDNISFQGVDAEWGALGTVRNEHYYCWDCNQRFDCQTQDTTYVVGTTAPSTTLEQLAQKSAEIVTAMAKLQQETEQVIAVLKELQKFLEEYKDKK